MLDIIMQLDISVRLTPQVTTIICHHMENVLLKKVSHDWFKRGLIPYYYNHNKNVYNKFEFLEN